MKKVEEYIDRVSIYPSNFNYIAQAQKINGSLLAQLRKLFDEAQKDAYNQALIDAGMLGKVELVLVKSGEHPIYEYRIEWESLKKLMK